MREQISNYFKKARSAATRQKFVQLWRRLGQKSILDCMRNLKSAFFREIMYRLARESYSVLISSLRAISKGAPSRDHNRK
jgi:hypothetical protein